MTSKYTENYIDEGNQITAAEKSINAVKRLLDQLSVNASHHPSEKSNLLTEKIVFLKDTIWEIEKVPFSALREGQLNHTIVLTASAEESLHKALDQLKNKDVKDESFRLSDFDNASKSIEEIFDIFSIYIHRVNTAWLLKIRQSGEVFGVHKTRIMDAAGKAEQILSHIEELNEKSSIRFLAADFISRRRALNIECIVWLIIMAGLFSTSGYMMLSFDLRGDEMWQNRLIDLGVIGFVMTLGFWIGKNFRAALHQRAINEHRISTLKTFQAFYDKVNNSELRDAVMVEVAQTIFGHTSPGYGSEKDINMSSTKLSDIVRAASLTKAN